MSADHITDLPRSFLGYNEILVVVDLFTRYTYLIAAKKNDTASKTYQRLEDRLILQGGLPLTILTDNGTRFKGDFHNQLTKCGIAHWTTSIYRAKSNGANERMNGLIKESIRSHGAFIEENWHQYLPSTEFFINSRTHSALAISPIELKISLCYDNCPVKKISNLGLRRIISTSLRVMRIDNNIKITMSQELVGSEIKLPLDTNQNDNGKRETQQMLRFFAGTALTLLCSRLIRRTMNNLKYTPKIFYTNNNPPNQIYQGEATKALVLSSGLSVGLFSMFIFGGCWFYDVSTLKEFSNGISGFFIRHGMGQQMTDIDESQDSLNSISDILNDEDH